MHKEDTLPFYDPKVKQALDPNYYPQTMFLNMERMPHTLVDDLVAPPAKTKEGEDQGEVTKGEDKGGDTKGEEDREENKRNKIQAEESGQDDDDYSDYLDLDFIY